MNPQPSTSAEELSLLGLGRFAVAHRRLVLGTGLAAFALVAVTTLSRPRTYTATAAFMPQAQNTSASRISSLAAQFGVSLPPDDPGSSPAFYEALLQSRDVMRATVLAKYEFRAGDDTLRGSLVDLYGITGRTDAVRRDKAVKELREDVEVRIGRQTGVVHLRVRTPWPELSRQVAARMIGLVSDFNVNRRQTQANAERRFVEARLGEVKDTLSAAEARLERFLERNREYRSSPQLMFEFDRLQREVTMRQDLYTTLAQSYEQARIEEVRNTPVLTIVEPPDVPAKPDPRMALLKSILALLVGSGIGLFLAAAVHAFGHRLPAARRPRAGERLPPDEEAAVREPSLPPSPAGVGSQSGAA